MTAVVAEAVPSERVNINADDVTVTTFRDSGAGGQHRNKTDSAVRMVHRPTGVMVTATESRSQQQNRQVAWQRLRAAVENQALAAAVAEQSERKAGQFGGKRNWTWCSWRDELVSPDGRRMSMKRALRGGMERLVP